MISYVNQSVTLATLRKQNCSSISSLTLLKRRQKWQPHQPVAMVLVRKEEEEQRQKQHLVGGSKAIAVLRVEEVCRRKAGRIIKQKSHHQWGIEQTSHLYIRIRMWQPGKVIKLQLLRNPSTIKDLKAQKLPQKDHRPIIKRQTLQQIHDTISMASGMTL